ncbi:MAG TPA: hypothetical protein VF040_08770 [Ktedonobacterales bacterium]
MRAEMICAKVGCVRDVQWQCETCHRYFCDYHFAWRETTYLLCWPCYETRKYRITAEYADAYRRYERGEGAHPRLGDYVARSPEYAREWMDFMLDFHGGYYTREPLEESEAHALPERRERGG